MHIHTLEQWQHPHEFEYHHRSNERKVLIVVGLTLVTMIAEIAAGMLFGSMALLADGWHMGTHAAALGITALAYYFARKHARDRRFSFGTGKIGVLGGFSSAVVLSVVALLMAVESIGRLLNPHIIAFNEAIAVAALGLTVNLISALLLQNSHPHDHHDHHDDGDPGFTGHDPVEHGQDHENEPSPSRSHQDHNMRGAYLHVLADALTSVLAIAALTAGKWWHWVWMDPVIGIVGAFVIAIWARGLLRDTGKILLDRDVDKQTLQRLYTLIEADADNRISDLHLWKVGANKLAAIVSIVTHFPRPAEHYKALLKSIPHLEHITIEVLVCESEPCLPHTSDKT
jgi:cation diffusion facilitator family transporter